MTWGRQRNILDFALMSLWRRRWRNAGVFALFTLVIFLFASLRLSTQAYTRAAEKILAQAPDIVVQRMQTGRQAPLPVAWLQVARDQAGVRTVAPRVWGYRDHPLGMGSFTVQGLDDQAFAFFLNTGEHRRPGQAVVGSGVARLMETGAGGNFLLARDDGSAVGFHVLRVLPAADDIIAADSVFIGVDEARDLFGISQATATDMMIDVANPEETETIAAKLSLLLPGARVLTRNTLLQTYRTVFGWRSGFATLVLSTVLAAFFILAWDRAAGMSPDERRQIAVLKMIGWQTTDILLWRFWEGLALALFSFGTGVTLAYVHVAFYDAGLFATVISGWSAIRPRLGLLPIVTPPDLLLLALCTIVPYLGVTIIPGWRAATVPPDSVLH